MIRLSIQKFFNGDLAKCVKICGVLPRWQQIWNKPEELTDRDKKILIWGLKQLHQYSSNEREQEANRLQQDWRTLSENMAQCKASLKQLQQKWENKVEDAKRVKKWRIAIEAFLGAVAAVGAVMVILTIGAVGVITAPVWVPFAIGGGALVAAGAGIGLMVYGKMNENAHMSIKQKIDDMLKMEDGDRKVSEFVQYWLEGTQLLKATLNSVSMDDQGDYDSEIASWRRIAEREMKLLNRLVNGFKLLKDKSEKALDQMREIQNKLN